MSANNELCNETAARIRELRESSDASIENTAAMMGISPDTLRMYEEGKTDIPIGILYAAAGIFGVDLTDLMTGKSPNLSRYCVVRSGKGPEIERYPGYRFQSLAFDFQNRLFEPLLVTLNPEMNETIAPVTHSGQEFNLVMSGKIRVIIGGSTIDLDTGDSIFFDPSIPHGQWALDHAPASFLTVIMHDHPSDSTKH